MTKRTPSLEAAILECFAEGISLGKICRQFGIARTTVHSWKRDDPDFADRYLDAQAAHADALIEEVLAMADNPPPGRGDIADQLRLTRFGIDVRLRIARIHMRQVDAALARRERAVERAAAAEAEREAADETAEPLARRDAPACVEPERERAAARSFAASPPRLVAAAPPG